MALESRVPVVLAERGLFAYSDHCLSLVEGVFDEFVDGGLPPSPYLVDLTCLTAAEFALSPALTYPSPVLPVASPFPVDEEAALLGLAKTNCYYIQYHYGAMEGGRHPTLADVTAFSGDASKLAFVGVDPQAPPTEIGAIARAVDEIEHEHRQSPADSARAVGESGVLRLQGFLWAVKLSLRIRYLDEAVTDAYTAFELSEPVGGQRLNIAEPA